MKQIAKAILAVQKECKGMVKPTWNANVGRCDVCGTRTGWSRYVKRSKRKKTNRKKH